MYFGGDEGVCMIECIFGGSACVRMCVLMYFLQSACVFISVCMLCVFVCMLGLGCIFTLVRCE